MGKLWGDTKSGVGKVACWNTKAEISLKRVKTDEKLLWRAYSNSATLFRTVPSSTPYGLLFPKIGVRNLNSKLQSLLSEERVKLRTANLADTFTGSIQTEAHEKFGRKGSVHGRIQGLPKCFEYPLLSQEWAKLRTSNYVRNS